MIVYEHTLKYSILPRDLINYAPQVWAWSNPDRTIASWMFNVFGITDTSDSTKLYVFMGAYIDSTVRYALMDSYADLLLVEESCWWDSTNQVMYFNVGLTNPHTFSTVDLLQLFGYTDTAVTVFNDITYPNIITSKPIIRRAADPLVYQSSRDTDLDIELKNNDIVTKLYTGALVFDYRFDTDQDITGQLAFAKWGATNDTAYVDLELLFKGIINNNKTSLAKHVHHSEDIRSKMDAEWPTYTFEDAGYDEYDVDEDLLTKIIPDGYGKVYKVEGRCVNRAYTIIKIDDDGKIDPLPDNEIDFDMTTWSKTSVDLVKTTKQIAKFTMYRVEKTAATATAFAQDSFVMLASIYEPQGAAKLSGYVKVPELYTQDGTSIDLYTNTDAYIGGIKIDFVGRDYSSAGVSNVRVKFLGEGEDLYAYYSYESTGLTIGATYKVRLYPDNGSTDDDVVAYFAGITVSDPNASYPRFIFSRELTTLHNLYYEKDNELTEITETSISDNIISIHDVDAHVDGDLTKGLANIYATCTLRPETNPFEIIKDLNLNERSTPYLDTYYNKTVCEAEQTKLADVGFIKDAPTSIYSIITELQSASTVGFLYDDLDKITIKCDDPNRTPTFNITKEMIINKNDMMIDSNTVLYADRVTVKHSYDHFKKKYADYLNTDYSVEVLARYVYEKPNTYTSMLTSAADALNATKVKLEDLSVARMIAPVIVPNVYIPDGIDIYDIGTVELSIPNRTFKGIRRVQCISIERDTEFDFTVFLFRERVYSSVFCEITGSCATMVLGEAVTPAVIGETVTPMVLGQLEE